MRFPAAALLSTLLPALVSSGKVAGETYSGLDPRKSAESFRIAPGFRIELAASEPDVADPVSIAWDERGRMWVAEMSDYPSGPAGGRVRVLEDRDGDGRYERSAVFAEGLPFPTSALPHHGGVLVSAAPDILYLEDTDQDGRSDVRRVVLTGFHPGNSQLRVNNLIRGLDSRIYGANGRSGGKVRRPGDPPESAVDIGQRDFRFHPDTFHAEAISGASQFGHAFDAWGHRFLSWNTVHIRQEVLSPRDLERQPRLLWTATVASISDHGDSARIYPLIPPPRTFNSESTDHFNAGCGLTVESGGIFPEGYAGNAYVCEPLLGLVHRDRLEPGPGPAWIARRGEEGVEFLASTDPWFHPVNLQSGPDGALYVVDFYRELVEHPEYVPLEIRGGIDFTRGSGRGRIWRILPEGVKPLPVEDLGALRPRELVERLRSPSGPVRNTAQRLLLERRELEVREPLARLAREGASPLPRLHALWTLWAMGALGPESLEAALQDPEPRLREAALKVARQGHHLSLLVPHLLRLSRDPQPPVRFHAALALGDLPRTQRDEEVVGALLEAALRDGKDPWFRAAILSSLRERELEFLEALSREAVSRDDRLKAGFAEEAAELAGGGRNRENEYRILALALEHLDRGSSTIGLAMGTGLAAGLKRSGHAPGARGGAEPAQRERAMVWGEFFRRASELGNGSRNDPAVRSSGARALAHATWELAEPVLRELLDRRQDLELQKAAARALSAQDHAEVPSLLLSAWPAATPVVRSVLFDGLLSRPERARALAGALESGEVALRDLDPGRREALLRALEPERRRRLQEAFRPGGSDRAAVVLRYRESAPAKGDAGRGEEVFTKNCASCHRFAGLGQAVGPDLSGIGKKSREEVLVALLDPSRVVVEGFTAYTVLTAGGETRTGILASETESAITLRRAEGIEETIPRASIRAMFSAGTSLMPEGIEASLSPSDTVDLIEYLRAGEPRTR